MEENNQECKFFTVSNLKVCEFIIWHKKRRFRDSERTLAFNLIDDITGKEWSTFCKCDFIYKTI